MKYGAMNFPVVPVLQEIELFARLGFDYLELAMDPPMAHYRELRARTSAIKQALQTSGMALVCHLPTFLSTADLTETIRRASAEEMLASLETARELGAEKAVLHPSGAAGLAAYVQSTFKSHAFDFLARMVDRAEELEITLCLENMFPRNMLGVEVEDLEEIFAAFPALKLTLDTGHAHIGDLGGRRLKGLVTRFGTRLGHLHFSDNHGISDEHLAIGEGSIDFPGLIEALNRVGYDDSLTLEVFARDRQELVDSRTQLQSLLDQPRRS